MAHVVALLAALHAADTPVIQITDRTVVFTHTSTDPKEPANTSGYNLGPSIELLPDGRLMAVWFSSPSEGAASQRIVQAFSSDQGHTWGAASVLQDFAGQADFDPVLFVAGSETFLFFSAFTPQIDIYFRRSTDSAKTWTEPVKLNQPNHTTRSNGIRLSTGELLVPLHLRGTKAGGVLKSSDGGQTWKRFGAVANPEGQGGEPTIAETKSGAVHMIGARPRRPASRPLRAPATCFALAMAPSSSPPIQALSRCVSRCCSAPHTMKERLGASPPCSRIAPRKSAAGPPAIPV
jgi:hypothetical protein